MKRPVKHPPGWNAATFYLDEAMLGTRVALRQFREDDGWSPWLDPKKFEIPWLHDWDEAAEAC